MKKAQCQPHELKAGRLRVAPIGGDPVTSISRSLAGDAEAAPRG